MNQTYQLDKEEQEILDAFEAGELVLSENQEEEKKIAYQAAKNSISKRKAISIRFLEKDLREVKVRAIQEGMPYQTFISSIIHRYLNGKVTFS